VSCVRGPLRRAWTTLFYHVGGQVQGLKVRESWLGGPTAWPQVLPMLGFLEQQQRLEAGEAGQAMARVSLGSIRSQGWYVQFRVLKVRELEEAKK
jgi:hypothetical protein